MDLARLLLDRLLTGYRLSNEVPFYLPVHRDMAPKQSVPPWPEALGDFVRDLS